MTPANPPTGAGNTTQDEECGTRLADAFDVVWGNASNTPA